MILIVDDSAHGLKSICHLISTQGCGCRCVGSGPKALKIIRAHPRRQPLLVILGQPTPEMDGLSILRAIRNDPEIGDTLTIIYSERFDGAGRERALALGATGCLSNGCAIGAGEEGIVSRILLWYENLGGIPNAHGTSRRRIGSGRSASST